MAILKKIFRFLLAIGAVLLACEAFFYSLREVWLWLFIGGGSLFSFWGNMFFGMILLFFADGMWDYWPDDK